MESSLALSEKKIVTPTICIEEREESQASNKLGEKNVWSGEPIQRRIRKYKLRHN